MWSAYTGVIHCVFDQILNLQNCFITPGGLRQINTCRQVPLQVIFKEKPTFRVRRLCSYLVHVITYVPARRRILKGGGRVFMADIDTALGQQIRDTLAKEFGEVNTRKFVLKGQQMGWGGGWGRAR